MIHTSIRPRRASSSSIRCCIGSPLLVCKPGKVSAELLQTVGLDVLHSLRILLQICIPKRQRFELRALEYRNTVVFVPKKAGESHVRSALKFHLVLVARGRLCECLTSPNWLLAKRTEIARTVHKQHGHMNGVPRVRAQPHDSFSLR